MLSRSSRFSLFPLFQKVEEESDNGSKEGRRREIRRVKGTDLWYERVPKVIEEVLGGEECGGNVRQHAQIGQ